MSTTSELTQPAVTSGAAAGPSLAQQPSAAAEAAMYEPMGGLRNTNVIV